MGTVDRVLPWRRHHEAAAPVELTPLLASYRRRHPEGAGGHDQPGLPGGRRGPPQPAALQRRELHQPPARRGPHRRRHRPRRDLRRRRPAPRRRRGHRDHPGRRRDRLRRRGRRHRRRCHQARADPVRLPRGAAGGDDAQDARRHGARPAGARHQARRSAAQHAHHRRHAAGQAAAHRPGDARHLRPAGPPPRDAGDQAAARGPLLRRPAPEALRRARPPRQQPLTRARGVPRGGDRRGPRPARRARHRRRGHRSRQAPVEPLREDGRQGPGVRRHLRSRRGARDRRLDEGLLRRAGVHPRALAAGGGPVQGLHRDAQVQPLPEPAHDGHRARRQGHRGADPHPRDAPAGGVGRRRPLGVQGRARRPATSTGSTGSSTGRPRSATRPSS